MLNVIFLIKQCFDYLIDIYVLAIFVYALLSWLPGAYESKLGQFLARIVEPFENKLRFFTIGGIDFSPVFALIIVQAFKVVVDFLIVWIVDWILI